jgi:hypothetical protein
VVSPENAGLAKCATINRSSMNVPGKFCTQADSDSCVWFGPVSEAEVSEEASGLANRAACFFANRLGIPTPEVRWFDVLHGAPEFAISARGCFRERPGTLGFAPADFSGVIYVRRTECIDVAQIMLTVAHEIRHVWQDSAYGKGWRSQSFDAAEEEAYSYQFPDCQDYPEFREAIEPRDDFSRELAAILASPFEKTKGVD